MKTSLALFLCYVGASLAQVVELNDSNFEHLTQAASGATTGDWFVKFYAPWCGHCKKLAPVWDKASESKEKPEWVNYARVDCDGDGRRICKRFGVSGFPTLKYFAKGKVYEFQGVRTLEGLNDYIAGEWKEAEGIDVPPGPTTLDIIKEYLQNIPHLDSILIVLGVVCVVTGYNKFATDKKKKPKNKNRKKK